MGQGWWRNGWESQTSGDIYEPMGGWFIPRISLVQAKEHLKWGVTICFQEGLSL